MHDAAAAAPRVRRCARHDHCDIPATRPQAKVTQHTNMMAGKRSAPIWALAAIAFLGWNEFMAVLWNPLLLAVGLLVAVFGYQMYNELDVDAEMQRGWVLGAMSIWNRLGATLSRVRAHGVVVCVAVCGAGGGATRLGVATQNSVVCASAVCGC
jgi:hypothetical protein